MGGKRAEIQRRKRRKAWSVHTSKSKYNFSTDERLRWNRLRGYSMDTDLRNAISGWELAEDVLLAGTGAVRFDAKLLPERVHGIYQVRQDCNTT